MTTLFWRVCSPLMATPVVGFSDLHMVDVVCALVPHSCKCTLTTVLLWFYCPVSVLFCTALQVPAVGLSDLPMVHVVCPLAPHSAARRRLCHGRHITGETSTMARSQQYSAVRSEEYSAAHCIQRKTGGRLLPLLFSFFQVSTIQCS